MPPPGDDHSIVALPLAARQWSLEQRAALSLRMERPSWMNVRRCVAQ